MDQPEEVVSRQVGGSRLFVRDVLKEAGWEDLFPWVDEKQLSDDMLQAISSLVVATGGQLDDVEPAPADPQARLHALLGRTGWHINTSTAVWESIVASVPLLVEILRAMSATADPLALYSVGAAFLALVDGFASSVQKLKPEEIELYFAVKVASAPDGSGASADAVAQCLSSQTNPTRNWTLAEIEQRLQRMAGTDMQVLEESAGRFRCV